MKKALGILGIALSLISCTAESVDSLPQGKKFHMVQVIFKNCSNPAVYTTKGVSNTTPTKGDNQTFMLEDLYTIDAHSGSVGANLSDDEITIIVDSKIVKHSIGEEELSYSIIPQ